MGKAFIGSLLCIYSLGMAVDVGYEITQKPKVGGETHTDNLCVQWAKYQQLFRLRSILFTLYS